MEKKRNLSSGKRGLIQVVCVYIMLSLPIQTAVFVDISYQSGVEVLSRHI